MTPRHDSRPCRLLTRSLRLASLAVALLTCWLTPLSASADRKIFAHTYPYGTLPAGALELEHYLDAAFDEVDDPATEDVEEGLLRPSWTHQVEVEMGLTDRLDLGFYNVARQKPFESFEYRGVKLRSRYRFGDEGDFLLDPAVYLEAAYFGDEIKFEQRSILAKRFGALEASLNLKFEQEFKLKPDKTEFELLFIPSFGLGYHITEHVALAAEYLGRMKVEHGELEYFAHYLGPVVSVAGRTFWWTIGVHPELNAVEERPDLLARSVFALMF
ncbi:MAG: hypothetical protein JRI23_25395 [Deltaproteobacteria bacterium]|jgi:hypothetical protein|nr:hypothetical protein [Deltaproteobacteria bacterium]MBW2535354.1 hypothetical protein [Deltaproteobacteria bacterium]